jgi:hypothetical protein
VNSLGNVHVTGRTRSVNSPTTQISLDKSHNGQHDMFLSVIDSSGRRLLYSTLLGGSDYDTGQSFVLHQHNNPPIAGTTHSAR